MSTQTTVVNNENKLHVDNDFSKIFIWGNEYDQGTFENNTVAEASFPAGTLLGRDSSTGNLVALASGTGTNGENIPVGVLAEDVTDLSAAGTVDVNYCIAGHVAAEKLIFQGSDDLDTVVALRTLKDRIQGDTKGIKIVSADELTAFDNQ